MGIILIAYVIAISEALVFVDDALSIMGNSCFSVNCIIRYLIRNEWLPFHWQRQSSAALYVEPRIGLYRNCKNPISYIR